MPGFVMPRGPSMFKVMAKYWEWQEKRLHFTSCVIPCADKEALSLKHFSTVNATRCKLFVGNVCYGHISPLKPRQKVASACFDTWLKLGMEN